MKVHRVQACVWNSESPGVQLTLRTLYSVADATGVNRLFAHINRARPLVLAFHGVTAEVPGHLCNYEGKHLHLPIFERIMERVARHYQVVPLARVVDWMEGNGELPEHAVALTFDDGYRNVFTQAVPVLQRFGMPATLFVVTDFVFHGRMLWPDRLTSAIAASDVSRVRVSLEGAAVDMPLASEHDKRLADARLTALCKSLPEEAKLAFLERVFDALRVTGKQITEAWADHAPIPLDEMKRLPACGIEVGSHTCSHGIVTRFAPDAMAQEMNESKRLIEQAMGRPCSEFSYPNGGPGDFSEQSRERVAAAGYRCAVTTIKRRVAPGDDRFAIPRAILTHNQVTTAEFSAHVAGLPAFLRAVRARVVPARRGSVPA